ncbi:O-methyltransferase [bacterium]|nr:O-methyltransferase [bacterium]
MVSVLEEMEEYAAKNNIPIMMKDGIEFLTKYIEDHHIKNILEIGTAIGYSSIKMALVSSDIHVTTIERDESRYEEAIKNIKKANLEEQIHVILKDALDVELKDSYDLIFIDAAKAQYIKFFEKYKIYLNKNGVIVSDNLNFHGLVHSKEPIESRNVRGLVRKLNNYIVFLQNNLEFETTFYELGDGVSISIKK